MTIEHARVVAKDRAFDARNVVDGARSTTPRAQRGCTNQWHEFGLEGVPVPGQVVIDGMS